MSASVIGKMNAEEFAGWCELPENEGKIYELHQGEVVELPSPGFLHGIITALITRILLNYAFDRNSGNVTSNDTGLVVSEDTVLGPDIMFFGGIKSIQDVHQGHVREVPLLCVEVISPSNRKTQMIPKVNAYHHLGVIIVWLIDPEERSVQVFQSGELPKLLDDTETLTGNGILPDFSCPVADLFRLPGTAS